MNITVEQALDRLAEYHIKSEDGLGLLAIIRQTLTAPRVPAAWMHDSPGRVDVIHAEVKKLLVDSHDAAGHLYRPLDKSEHYTIPLYATPQPTPDVSALVEALRVDAERYRFARESVSRGKTDIVICMIDWGTPGEKHETTFLTEEKADVAIDVARGKDNG